MLLQSGLDEKWWADSMECYTYLRNILDLLSDGKTPFERRFGKPLKGPTIPFGSLVEYHPKTAKDQTTQEPINLERNSYLDCSLNTLCTRVEFGMVTYWLQTLRPIADGRINTLGGDQDLKTSTSIRQRPIQGESHLDFLGSSTTSRLVS